MSGSPPDEKPNVLWAIGAGVMPLSTMFTALVVPLVLLTPVRAAQLFEEAGVGAVAATAAFVLLSLLNAVLLFFCARGVRVPAVVPLLGAVLPPLIAHAGMRWAVRRVDDALLDDDAASKATVLAAGIAESIGDRIFGAIYGAAGFAAVAVGLAFAAAANGKQLRSQLAVICAAAALPLAVSPMLVVFARLGPALYLPLLLGLLAVGVGALAGGALDGVGGAERFGAGALIAAAAAVVAASGLVAVMGVHGLFAGLAGVGGEDRMAVVAAGAEELSAATGLERNVELAAMVLIGLALVLSLRPKDGRAPAWGASLLGAATLLLLVGIDRGSNQAVAQIFARIGAPSVKEPGLVWMQFDGAQSGGVPQLVALPDALVDVRSAHRAAWREEEVRVLFERGEQPAELEARAKLFGLPAVPTLGVAADARLEASQVRLLIDGARAAGWKRLEWLGQPVTKRALPTEGVAGWLSALVPNETRALTRLTGPRPERKLVEGDSSCEGTVGLPIAPTAALSGLFALAGRSHCEAVFAPEEQLQAQLPAEEAHPLAGTFGGGVTPKPSEVLGYAPEDPRGQPNPPRAPTVKWSSLNVKGALTQNEVRRVLDTRRAALRYCYERALLRNPELKGRLTARWRITGSGATGDVEVSGTDFDGTDVAACAISRFKTVPFPPRPTETEVFGELDFADR